MHCKCLCFKPREKSFGYGNTGKGIKQISINYGSEYNNSEFKVNYLKATKVNDGVEFELSYESPEDSDFSFFNPPNGDKLMKTVYGGIKEGKNTTKFKLTQKEFKKVLQDNTITMKFGFHNNLGWIFIEKDQLKFLISNNNETVKKTGWISVENKEHKNNWYYILEDGTKAYGWQLINGAWYYFDSNGIMLKGWNYINGTWYYFYESGAMAVNVVIDGWKVNGSGVAIPF